jgi:hypothetical protein
MFGEYAFLHCKHPDLRLQVNAANGKFKHSFLLKYFSDNIKQFSFVRRRTQEVKYIPPLLPLSFLRSVLDYSGPEYSGANSFENLMTVY